VRTSGGAEAPELDLPFRTAVEASLATWRFQSVSRGRQTQLPRLLPIMDTLGTLWKRFGNAASRVARGREDTEGYSRDIGEFQIQAVPHPLYGDAAGTLSRMLWKRHMRRLLLSCGGFTA